MGRIVVIYNFQMCWGDRSKSLQYAMRPSWTNLCLQRCNMDLMCGRHVWPGSKLSPRMRTRSGMVWGSLAPSFHSDGKVRLRNVNATLVSPLSSVGNWLSGYLFLQLVLCWQMVGAWLGWWTHSILILLILYTRARRLRLRENVMELHFSAFITNFQLSVQS